MIDNIIKQVRQQYKGRQLAIFSDGTVVVPNKPVEDIEQHARELLTANSKPHLYSKIVKLDNGLAVLMGGGLRTVTNYLDASHVKEGDIKAQAMLNRYNDSKLLHIVYSQDNG